MDSAGLHINFRLSHVLTVVTCILYILPPTTTAYSLPAPGKAAFQHQLSKRDVYMGLKLHCQVHPANCPGGLMVTKKSDLLGALLSRNSPSSYGLPSRDMSTAYKRQDVRQQLRMFDDLVQLRKLIETPSVYPSEEDEARLYD
ncbi:neuroactive polyprotein R15 isoform X1 [Aplysia californica]|uniref:Isoform R15-1 of Neuroactive polyprotein R15 n=1 Tax=Aplysia californica TaxID=6500 RepID=P12285-2|nr:neuroactive polyprotein R15 isoform X1 [Aplysia californica]AAA27774.1 R15-1 neuroactive peptide precursor [Aplysia sp.]